MRRTAGRAICPQFFLLLIEPAKFESLYVGIHAKPLFLGIAALGKSSYLCSRKQETM